jgi:glycosyltransferase involved in cell wall biosynthesis
VNPAPPPRVSIVTPLYNNAEHLCECIESILAQTYHNWDCTIVNNCSTDGSAEIAHRYAAKDSRIRVHDHSQFLSALANHNASLRLSSPTCKYCKIVFADDWIFPECLERMVALAEDHPSVGIVGAYTLEGRRVTCTGLPYHSKVFSGYEVCRQHLLNRVWVFGSANSLLYRADLVRKRDPFYDETNVHADDDVCFALLKSCDFGFVHQVLTFTRVRQGSLNAKSSEMRTFYAGSLHTLVTHGPDYLSDEELKMRLEQHLSDYYRFLGRSLLLGRGRRFWDYHKSKMLEAGAGFSRARLMRGLLATLLDLALNPKSTIEKLSAGSNSSLAERARKPASPPAAISDRGDSIGR